MAIPLGALLLIAGEGFKGFGAFQAAEVRSGELEYDAYIAQQDARLIEKAGKLEQARVVTAGRRALARAIAIAAASGRDISGGSPLAVIEANERAFALDEQIVSFNKNIAVGRKLSEAALLYGSSRGASKLGVYTSLLGMGATAAKHGNFGVSGGKAPKVKSGASAAFPTASAVSPSRGPKPRGGGYRPQSPRYGPVATP